MSRDALALAAARGSGQLVMVAVFALAARDLGVERFGLLVTAFSLATVLSGLIDFGAGNYWVREFTSGRLRSTELVVRGAGKVAMGAAIAGILVAIAVVLPDPTMLLTTAGLLVASVLSMTHQSLLVASRANITLAAAAIADRVCLALAYLVVVSWTTLEPDAAFVIAYVSGAVVLATITIVRLPELRLRPAWRMWKSTWRGTGYYGMSSAFVAMQSLDVVIGGAAAGAGAAGGYGAVARWIAPISLATNAFATLLTPIASAAADRTELWSRLRSALWLPAVSVAVALMMVIAADPLVDVVLGEEFSQSADVLRLMACAAAVSVVSQIASTLLQARRRERQVASAMAVAVGTQLALVAPLAIAMGSHGMALALLVGQSVLLAQLAVRIAVVLRG